MAGTRLWDLRIKRSQKGFRRKPWRKKKEREATYKMD
jgi:hypothetical protein